MHATVGWHATAVGFPERRDRLVHRQQLNKSSAAVLITKPAVT